MQASTIGGTPISGMGPGLMRTRAEDTSLWSSREVLNTLLAFSLGVVGDFICWWGVSGVGTFKQEVPWLLGSIAATGPAVIGLAFLLIAGARSVTDLRDQQVSRLVWLIGDGRLGPKPSDAQAPWPGAKLTTLAIVSGSQRYHNPDCQMARGKAKVALITRDEATARLLLPCGVCEPV